MQNGARNGHGSLQCGSILDNLIPATPGLQGILSLIAIPAERTHSYALRGICDGKGVCVRLTSYLGAARVFSI